MNENILDVYYKNIVRKFQFKGKKEKRFLLDLKKQISEYKTQNNLTYENLVESFGTPDDVYNAYIDSLDEKYIGRILNHKKILKKLIIVCITCIIGLAAYAFYKIKDEANNVRNQQVQLIESIIEEEE